MQASVSVVMPFYKNERTLLACLDSFSVQQQAAPCEIIVVDDGGPVRASDICDPTTYDVPVTLLRTERAGQSGATNAGIRAAQGDIVMLTCADIIASPQLLAEHLKAHACGPERAVLGYLPYAPTLKMTPFMQFLRTSGVQFDYDAIDNADRVNCLSLYAPNVSIRAKHLQTLGGFDERFTYGYQDTDLGLRLEKIGVQLIYRARAIGYHDHPNDFLSFVRRQELMGEASLLMLALHPDQGFEEIFTSGAVFALPRLKLFEALLADALRIEAHIAERPSLFPSMRQNLFHLYRLVLLLAVYRGTLQAREAYPAALKARISSLLAQPLGSQAAVGHVPGQHTFSAGV